MKKRLLSLLLCLCMVFALLPAAALAADTVNLVTLTITAPAAGKTPATTATLQANASSYVKSVSWTGELDSAGKFQAGKSYTVTVALGIRDGVDRTFKTTKAELLTINGKEATIVSETDTELKLSCTFSVKAALSPVISKLTITGLTEPKQGATPDKSVTIDRKDAFSTVQVGWLATGWDDSKPFDPLLEYKVQVHLVLNKGFTLDPAIFNEGAVTINGKTATVLRGFNDTYFDVYYTFPKLDLAEADGNVSRISIGGVVGPSVAREMEVPTVDSMLYFISSYEWSDGPDYYGNYKDDTVYTLSIVLNTYMSNRFSEKLNTPGKNNPYISRTSSNGYDPVIKSYSETELELTWKFYKTTTYKGVKPAVMVDSPFVFDGGSGTYNDPYLISTAAQLNAIRKGLDKHYRLTRDIDLSSWGNWIPIGSNEAYGGGRSGTANAAYLHVKNFVGSLDGDGHVISGMTIKIDAGEVYRAERLNVRYYGLFMGIDGTKTEILHDEGSRKNDPYSSKVYRGVRDLGVVNYSIDIHHSVINAEYWIYAGAIAGTSHAVGIYNCYSAGGAITIDMSDAGDVHLLTRVGGLVGDGSWTDFRDCYNASTVTVTAKGETGVRNELEGAGICGSSIANWFMSCFNAGTITMPQYQDKQKGGTQLYSGAACGITTIAWAPDFPVLYHSGEAKNNYIWNCYNSGAITGEYAAGIMLNGTSDYYADNCYNVGVLTGSPVSDASTMLPTVYQTIDVSGEIEPFGTEYMRRLYTNGTSISGDKWQYSEKLGRMVLKSIPEDSLDIPVVKPETSTVGGFTDVKTTDWFADSVLWAVEKKITDGTSDTTFSPSATCTRAQILTFLWRAVGSPKAAIANPFTDVSSGDYYYDAALWAASKGMVTGSSFAGGTPCTRASTVTYLWQNAGAPGTTPVSKFTDVPAEAAYAQAVAWAVQKEVTDGTSETTFSPDNTCNRGQIVTFLLRAMK